MADFEELNTSERAALADLRQEAPPPPALEANVVAALRSRGLVRAAGAFPAARLAASLAAGLALFFAGLFVGGRPASTTPSQAPRYLLLLEGADTVSAEEESARVREYSAWAQSEAKAGHLLSGEKLDPEARVLGPIGSASGGASVRGFFVISAKDDAEALSIANGCPHLRHGGRVVLRRIAQL